MLRKLVCLEIEVSSEWEPWIDCKGEWVFGVSININIISFKTNDIKNNNVSITLQINHWLL